MVEGVGPCSGWRVWEEGKGREGKGAKGSAKGSERRLKKVEEAICG